MKISSPSQMGDSLKRICLKEEETGLVQPAESPPLKREREKVKAQERNQENGAIYASSNF